MDLGSQRQRRASVKLEAILRVWVGDLENGEGDVVIADSDSSWLTQGASHSPQHDLNGTRSNTNTDLKRPSPQQVGHRSKLLHAFGKRRHAR